MGFKIYGQFYVSPGVHVIFTVSHLSWFCLN